MKYIRKIYKLFLLIISSLQKKPDLKKKHMSEHNFLNEVQQYINIALQDYFDTIQPIEVDEVNISSIQQQSCKLQLPKFIRILVYSYVHLKMLAIKLASLSQKERQMIEKSSILLNGDLRLPDINLDDIQYWLRLDSHKKIQMAYMNTLILRLYKRVNVILPSKQENMGLYDTYNYLDTILNKIQRKVIVDISAQEDSSNLLLLLLKNFQCVEFNILAIRQADINIIELKLFANAFRSIQLNNCLFLKSQKHCDKFNQYRLSSFSDKGSHLDRDYQKYPGQFIKIFSQIEDLSLSTSSKFFKLPNEFSLASLKNLKLIFKQKRENALTHSLLNYLSQMTSLEFLNLKLHQQFKMSFPELYDFLCEVLLQRQSQNLALQVVQFQTLDEDICLHYLLDKISLLQSETLNTLRIKIGKKNKLMLMNSLFQVYQNNQFQLQPKPLSSKKNRKCSAKSYEIKFIDGSQTYKNKYKFTVKNIRKHPENSAISAKQLILITLNRIEQNKMGTQTIEVCCYRIKIF